MGCAFPNGALMGGAKCPPRSPHRRRACPGSRLQGEDPGPACLCCLDSREPHTQGRPVAAPKAVPRDGARPHSARCRGRERGIPASPGQAFPGPGFLRPPVVDTALAPGPSPRGPHTPTVSERQAGPCPSPTHPPAASRAERLGDAGWGQGPVGGRERSLGQAGGSGLIFGWKFVDIHFPSWRNCSPSEFRETGWSQQPDPHPPSRSKPRWWGFG